MYKEREADTATCLECGREMYRVPNKKFCCESCKNRYHNRIEYKNRRYQTHVLTMLKSNYNILKSLLSNGVHSISIAEIAQAGFTLHCMTGFRKGWRKEDEYLCFDISYRQSQNRIFEIRQLDLAIFEKKSETER